ncbi:alpha/beta fold hydrolase [Actinocorallia sp. API 0066]|uniref:thioesterase II family protein n=1 Tax=Actinocorallia sp. API 0066 TaxID=2896846 RepID=UPI001E5C02F5|nr:alpha/beta fold hydrolase [Actinocorallia sp. API 0066]MCD0451594.1 alpha/beta fold hydrolase [Actinocorallia sp. API 0066]
MTAANAPVRGDWLRVFAATRADAPRLVCLPHAGGSASFFAPLARALAPRVRVLAVQYPGRLDRRREPAVADVRELAALVADAVNAEPGPPPAALFGHSMGALVAFEAVRSGRLAPGRIFASAARSPDRTRVDPSIVLDDDALIGEVLDLGGTTPELRTDPALRALVLPALRGDYRALHSYTPEPGARVDCPVTVLTGDRDPLVPVRDALGWRDSTTGAFDFTVLQGDHFYLTPRLTDVADAVRAALL